MKFSKIEIKDILAAWLLISLSFAILLSGGYQAFTNLNIFAITLLIATLTAGIGFLLHELMHKYVAQRYHFQAEFTAFYPMLFITLILSFFGFIIAAPGAVFIRGRITKEKNGKISLAGPLTNIVLAILFLILLLTIPTKGLLNLFLSYGVTINSLLAAFNMIPFPPFDGWKVYEWNKLIYFIIVVIAIAIYFIKFLV